MQNLLAVLAIATMTLGNLLAVRQHNLHRLLAYSSIAHSGYMLVGLAIGAGLDNRWRRPHCGFIWQPTAW